MAVYHTDDIRNLKKMIGFIEDHTVSIGEEELKKEIFALEFEALSEEEDILHTLFTPFSKFCDEWRFEESEKDAERGAVKDSYGGRAQRSLKKNGSGILIWPRCG